MLLTKKIKITFVVSIITLGLIIFLTKGYLIVINKSDSLPLRWALIKKGVFPAKKGEIFAFFTDGGGFYKKKKVFVKKLASRFGSVIEVEGDRVFVDGKYIGNIRQHSSSGKRINVNNQKIVKKRQYFAFADHPRSFDSRYKEIGLINEKNIIGTAIFIF